MKLKLFLFISLSTALVADHGPLTTAAGATLVEPTTLKAGQFAASAGIAFNSYENLSDAHLRELATKNPGSGDHVDAIRQSLLGLAGLGFGISETLEAGARVRYYRGEKIREGLVDSGGTYRAIDLGTVAGMADPDTYVKWRILKSTTQTLAIAGYVKVPLGKYYPASSAKPLATYAGQFNPSYHLVGGGVNNDPLSERYSIEPSLTPGSGAWDFSGAVAWSAWLGEGMSVTASLMYTRRLANDNYKLGDSLEGGASLQKRWGSRDEANVSLFAEITARNWAQAESFSQKINNTGGTMVFMSPGITFAWPSGVAVTVFHQVPVARYLNGEQQMLSSRSGFNFGYLF
jgi:hypothetical protein